MSLAALGAPVYGSARTGVVATQNDPLNLRAGAGLGAAILKTMPRGSSVSIIGETPSFFQVVYDGTTGYASKQYIKETPFVPPDVAQAPSPSGGSMLTEDGNRVDKLAAGGQHAAPSLLEKLSDFYAGRPLTDPVVLGSLALPLVSAFALYKVAMRRTIRGRRSF